MAFIAGRRWLFAPLILLFLWTSWDNRRDWDENTYLHHAAYLSVGNLDAWLSQTSRAVWEYDWYRAKLSHLALLDALFSLTGTGRLALFSISLVFALMIAAGAVFWGLILKRITGDEGSAVEAAVLMLTTPLALYLSYKALTETTAFFFISLSIWLLVRSWSVAGWKRGGLSLGCALAFLGGTTSRMEVVVLFYAFAAGLFCYRPRNWKEIVARYLFITGVIVAVLIAYRLVSGINPYAAAGNQELSHAVRDNGYNISNTLYGVGFLFPLMLLGISTLNRPLPRLGFVLYALPAVALFPVLLLIALRHQYMSIPGAGILAYAGLKWLKAHTLRQGMNTAYVRIASFLLIALVLVGNIYIVDTLAENGLDGAQIDRVIGRMKELYPGALILVDSPTNTYAYLKVAYPELHLGLTSPGTGSDPEPLNSMEKFQARLERGDVLYLSPYFKSRNWVERLIDYLKGRRVRPADFRSVRPWLISPGIKLTPVAAEGRYRAFLISVDHKRNE